MFNNISYSLLSTCYDDPNLAPYLNYTNPLFFTQPVTLE